ncbi:MAG TPA: GYF domain-containing protein [Chitinophagaceae bacterium]
MEQKIWWYSLNNEQKGPVSQEELNVLVNQNSINPSTLVWKEGLQSWINFTDINGAVDNVSQSPPLPPRLPQANVTQPQSGNGYPQQNNGYPQPGYPQPNISQSTFNSQANTASPNALNFVTDNYYRAEFEKIISSNESYKGKWNWWAFFFSWVWCFTKGLWQYALLVLIPTFVLPYFLPFIVGNLIALAAAIFFGTRGTWLYYNLKMKNKQLS